MLELRDPELARRHILAGLWLSRIAAPAPQTTPQVLQWLLSLANEGHAVPPIGFLADVGYLTFGAGEAPPAIASRELPGVEPGLLRRYEDYCLGKLYADLAFERGSDAVLRYAEQDRGRGLAYLVERLLFQTDFEGTLLNPAAIRSLQQLPPEEVLRQAWQTLAEGLSDGALQQYDALIDSIKNTGDLLAPADILELERGTALAEFGQRLALRQVLRAAERLAENLPRQRPRLASKRRQVATRLLTEDAYPVGGFSSISTKGTIESLLHSQLVYLERGQRPDLFDIKYVRDELLYYSRDENQFLRRRTTLLVVLAPDLATARTKDPALPYQRIVLTLGLLLSVAQKLREWLSDEALELHFVLLTKGGEQPLADEQALLELLLADQIEHGAARVESLASEKLPAVIAAHSRRSLVRCVVASAGEPPNGCGTASPMHLLVSSAQPVLEEPFAAAFRSEEPGLTAWQEVLQTLIYRLL